MFPSDRGPLLPPVAATAPSIRTKLERKLLLSRWVLLHVALWPIFVPSTPLLLSRDCISKGAPLSRCPNNSIEARLSPNALPLIWGFSKSFLGGSSCWASSRIRGNFNQLNGWCNNYCVVTTTERIGLNDPFHQQNANFSCHILCFEADK